MKRPHPVRWAFAVALSIATSHHALAQTRAPSSPSGVQSTNALVIQPRPFGYVIGDVLSQRVLLQDVDVDLAQLPVPRRIGVWWDRHAVNIERASDGRRWLRVDYQLINAPQKLATVTLPAWDVESKSGAVKLAIPAWPVSVTPLTPETAFTQGGLSDIRPDRPAPVIATAPIRRQLGIWSTALVVTLAAWIAWLLWRNWSATMNQPFARAQREIRALDKTSAQAWQALHRAFDLTARRVVQTDTLDSLFQRAPHLLPLRSDIEKFFAASNERFFGTGREDSGLSVRALCGELRRIEKRYES